MPDPSDAPRWELLPHDPVGFFELAEGFGRKDLKRAYNRLLRAFKPEKFPAEFQKIRAAFEELDEDLRYHGTSTRSQAPAPQTWHTEASPPPSPAADAAAKPRAEKKRLVDRLATESPAALFEELKGRTNKSPYDYYALALLSDVVEKSATGFARWLIEGIAQYRSDGALKQLLHETFRGPQSAAGLLKLLPLAARAIRTDEFYPLTEPAWRVVLEECPFGDFTQTFDRCAAELRDSHITGRIAFLIHMLKSALWRDPQADGWSARQLRFVEEHFESIPPWLEWDVELLSLAREYLAVREQFSAGSPLRSKMDAALKDYFTAPQQVGDRSIVAAQMEILGSGDALMDEFPLDDRELLAKFYPIWAWASHDVAERQSIAKETEVNENIWASRAAALLERLEKECNGSRIGWMWTAAIGARLAGWASICATIVAVFYVLCTFVGPSIGLKDDEIPPIGILGGIGIGVVVTYFTQGALDQRLWVPLNGRYAAKCYRDLWRRELMDFQRRSHVPDRFFRALFARFSGKSSTAGWIHEFVQQDYAPALLAGAQRYEA